MLAVRSFLALLAVIALFAQSTTCSAEERIALVIGNSAYQHTAKLKNPTNDASDMVAALKGHGFTVLEGIDLTKTDTDRKILEFARALVGAQVGVFFYAGHGLQVGGKNYLVPINASLTDAASLDFETVQLDLVQRAMEREAKTNIIFLDACRDNPLARNLARTMGTRSAIVGQGLAPVESGVGTLISFSTQPGNVALDGTGRNSPFAGALAKQILEQKDDLSTLLINVRNEVMRETRNVQVPWEHSALRARFYFLRPGPAELPPVQQIELAFWSTVKDSGDPRFLQEYLDRYPKGSFAGLARVMISRLKEEEQERAAVAARDEAQRQRLADEARQAAEARRRDEAKRVEVETAAMAEKLKASEEARKGADAARLAMEKRLAALKVEEDARKALDASGGQKNTVSATPADTATKMPPMVPSSEQIAVELQRQLKRVGCDPGAADGRWTDKTKKALAEFAKRASATVQIDYPSQSALEAVAVRADAKQRVCPLVCTRGEIESGDKCVAKASAKKLVPGALKREPPPGTLRSGETVLVDDGSCPAGQIKQVTGGSNREYGTNIPRPGSRRTSRCISR